MHTQPTADDLAVDVPALLAWLEGKHRATATINPWQLLLSLSRRVLAAEAEAEVWHRLAAWRKADTRRIARVDCTWADERGPIWEVQLYPGVTMFGRAATAWERAMLNFNPRLYLGTEERNATMLEVVRAAMDYHEELEAMKGEEKCRT